MVSYLSDTNVLEKYDGINWVDITADSIAKGLIDAKGDLIAGTADNTPARLAIGTNGHVLTADSTTSTGLKWAAGGGKVLQVVSAVYSTQTDSTSTTFADTGLTANITPSAATSRVLVLVTQSVFIERADTDTGMALRLLRGATEVYETGGTAFYGSLGLDVTGSGSSTIRAYGVSAMSYLDSPNTTSAVTYKTQFRRGPGSGTVSVQRLAADSSIVLLEIGA
jgi:hypothetical protein